MNNIIYVPSHSSFSLDDEEIPLKKHFLTLSIGSAVEERGGPGRVHGVCFPEGRSHFIHSTQSLSFNNLLINSNEKQESKKSRKLPEWMSGKRLYSETDEERPKKKVKQEENTNETKYTVKVKKEKKTQDEEESLILSKKKSTHASTSFSIPKLTQKSIFDEQEEQMENYHLYKPKKNSLFMPSSSQEKEEDDLFAFLKDREETLPALTAHEESSTNKEPSLQELLKKHLGNKK